MCYGGRHKVWFNFCAAWSKLRKKEKIKEKNLQSLVVLNCVVFNYKIYIYSVCLCDSHVTYYKYLCQIFYFECYIKFVQSWFVTRTLLILMGCLNLYLTYDLFKSFLMYQVVCHIFMMCEINIYHKIIVFGLTLFQTDNVDLSNVKLIFTQNNYSW